MRLARADFPAAAIKHLELAVQLAGPDPRRPPGPVETIKANPENSLWEKNPYVLWEAPDGVSPEYRESFDRAIRWANDGLWSSSASAFELLAAGSGAGAIADRNRGLCLLWLADDEGASATLKRYIQRSKPTTDAVELEALCQRIGKVPPRDLVEFVQLKWSVRNRERLLAALQSDLSVIQGESRPLDLADPESPDVDAFVLLDRSRSTAHEGLKREDIPSVLGDVLVGADAVYLETYDDGRLDRLSDRFTTLAGASIPPAHPKTRVIRKEPRDLLALSWRWQLPEGLGAEDQRRLEAEQFAHIVRDVWPKTPHPFLRWRTPLQTAKAGDAETSLRAAVLLLETGEGAPANALDWNEFRSSLGLKPEPALDPDTVDIDRTHIGRLGSIPADRLDDDRLIALYKRARQWGATVAVENAARRIAAQPSLLIKAEIETVVLYGDLARYAATRRDRELAELWLAQGQNVDPPLKRSAHAIAWKMLGLEIDMALLAPEDWVPKLAGILEQYCVNREATSAVFTRLLQLGLVQLRHDPEKPEQAILDTRILESLLAQYGPRVVGPAAEPGGAATRGQIWTPGAAAGPGSVWTPGSASAPGPGRQTAKLIVPGQ